MHYTIYKTTNNISGKIYIGKHQTKNINDDYVGSGLHLKRSIQKHGIENFTKVIIHDFDNDSEMTRKEIELVTEEFCNRKDTYNICLGGQGGFSYINSKGLNVDVTQQRENNPSFSKNASLAGAKAKQELFKNNPEWSHNYRKKLSESAKGQQNFKGKTHTEETKKRMRNSHKNKHDGSKNSQYGTMWITNGTENKKIKRIDSIPVGWYKGRNYSGIV